MKQRLFGERLSSALGASMLRLLLLPIIGVVGLVNTRIIVEGSGSELFGIVNTIATLATLLPVSDLGVGAAVNSSVAIATQDDSDPRSMLPVLKAACRRLLLSSAVLLVALLGLAISGAWSLILHRDLDMVQNIQISAVLAVFALGIVFSVGNRVLLGAGRSVVAILIGISANFITLGVALLLRVIAAPPLLFAGCGYLGLAAAAVIASCVALRYLRKSYDIRIRDIIDVRLQTGSLSGSGSMLVILIALPLALESGRIIIAHRGTVIGLSEFALAAQFYALLWSVFSTFGAVLWRQFAQARADPRGSMVLWRKSVLQLGGLAAVAGIGLCVLGPEVSSIVSGGQLHPDYLIFLGLAALLTAQCLHLPGGVMLTTPRELGWQSRWIVAMAIATTTGAYMTVPTLGPAGVSLSAAASVILFQVCPDVLSIRRMVRGRAITTRVGVMRPDADH